MIATTDTDRREQSAKDGIAKKSRETIFMVSRLLCLFFLICAWWHFCRIINAGDTAVIRTPQAAPLPPQGTSENCRRFISYVVRQGDTFFGILGRYGISRDIANGVYRSLKPLGLQSLFPRDSVVLTVGANGALSAFSVLSRLRNWYRLTIDGAVIRAQKTPVTTSSYRCLVRGVLSTSLSEDLAKMGVGDACVAMFADIFAWDINFFVDPQEGDTFDIVVEKKYAEGRFIGYGDILAARYVNAGRPSIAIGLKKDGDIIHYYNLDGKSLQKQFLKAPLRFSHISSRFSLHRTHPVLGIVRPHLGIDYAAPVGTPVYAAADGTVRFAGESGGYGNLIRIYHGGAYETYYGHLSAFARNIHTGAFVKQADCIGFVGQTGLATGPHLDYRMTRGGSFVNPLTMSLPSTSGISDTEHNAFAVAKQEYAAIFGLRLGGSEGCFVLDIETSRKDGEATRISEYRPAATQGLF